MAAKSSRWCDEKQDSSISTAQLINTKETPFTLETHTLNKYPKLTEQTDIIHLLMVCPKKHNVTSIRFLKKCTLDCNHEIISDKLSSRNILQNNWPDQPWDFFGRNDAKAETPVLWPPHVKIMLGGIGGRRKRGQQRMRWLDGIQRLDGCEFE